MDGRDAEGRGTGSLRRGPECYWLHNHVQEPARMWLRVCSFKGYLLGADGVPAVKDHVPADISEVHVFEESGDLPYTLPSRNQKQETAFLVHHGQKLCFRVLNFAICKFQR